MTPDKYKRGELIETSERSKREVYTDFATLLNETLHGTDYALDIDKRDVAALINRLLVEHKSLLGPGGYIERGRYKRLNRAINRSFLSNRKQNFNGSLQEWKMGRKHEMEDKERREKGLPTREEEKARAQAREEEIRTRKARELADSMAGPLLFYFPSNNLLTCMLKQSKNNSTSTAPRRQSKKRMPH